MSKDKVHDEPSETDAEGGVVIVDGPDGVAVLLTPAAADATASRLNESAEHAREQKQP